MDHAGARGRRKAALFVLFGQNSQHLVVGVPVVDDDGKLQVRGKIKELPEDPNLDVLGREPAVIVEPRLADGHDLGV